MSKGSTSITLTPHHDVPMIFAAKANEDSEDSPAVSTSSSSCQGRPCAQECGGRLSAESTQSSSSTSQESSTTASPPSQSEAEEVPKKKTRKRNKQRFVTSKYTKAPSARHNLFTHFPSDPDCEICKNDKYKKSSLQSRNYSGTIWSTSSSKVWRQVNRRPQNAHG